MRKFLLFFIANVTLTLAVFAQGSSEKILSKINIAVLETESAKSLADIFSFDFGIPKRVKISSFSEVDIEEILSTLPAHIKSTRPDIYKKLGTTRLQLVAITINGERFALVSGFAEILTRDSDSWRHSPVVVEDGGSSFWRVRYSFKTKKFTKLSTNGVA